MENGPTNDASHYDKVCDKTTIVLVGRQMPDSNPKRDPIDGCEVRHVRGEWSEASLARGLPDERERRPDLVLLFNADAYACPWWGGVVARESNSLGRPMRLKGEWFQIVKGVN